MICKKCAGSFAKRFTFFAISDILELNKYGVKKGRVRKRKIFRELREVKGSNRNFTGITFQLAGRKDSNAARVRFPL